MTDEGNTPSEPTPPTPPESVPAPEVAPAPVPPPSTPPIAPTPEVAPTPPVPEPSYHASSPASEARDPASEPSSSGLATGPQPHLTAEAAKEISASITEAVKDVIMQDPLPEPPAAVPAASSSSATPPPSKNSSRGHMLTVVRARKAERLEKIVALAKEKGSITNDDVEKLLKVSDATATNYLRELVKAGRLKRSGARFHEHYEPISG